jgi:hypothetical protein
MMNPAQLVFGWGAAIVTLFVMWAAITALYTAHIFVRQ